jgi:hypothetical protein
LKSKVDDLRCTSIWKEEQSRGPCMHIYMERDP